MLILLVVKNVRNSGNVLILEDLNCQKISIHSSEFISGLSLLNGKLSYYHIQLIKY